MSAGRSSGPRPPGATPRLPQLELECMKVLWRSPGASVAQVRATLTRPLAYTTVMTVLERMSVKGVVARRKKGRSYVYSPVLDLDSARTQAVHHLLSSLFDGDRDALLRYVSESDSARRSRARVPSRPLPAAMDDTLL